LFKFHLIFFSPCKYLVRCYELVCHVPVICFWRAKHGPTAMGNLLRLIIEWKLNPCVFVFRRNIDMLFDSIAFFFFCDENIRHIHVWRFQHFLMLYFAYSISSAQLFFFFFIIFWMQASPIQLAGRPVYIEERRPSTSIASRGGSMCIHSFLLSLSLSLSLFYLVVIVKWRSLFCIDQIHTIKVGIWFMIVFF